MAEPERHAAPTQAASVQQALAEARHQQRLAEQYREEWTALVDAIPDAVFLHDVDGRILRANRAYAARAGLPVQQLIGRPYWEVFPRRDAPFPACAGEARSLRPLEETVAVGGHLFRSRSHPLQDAGGRYRGSLHVLEDVTEGERGRRRLGILLALVEELSLQRDLEQLGQRAVDGVVEIAGVGLGAVALLEPDGEHYRFHWTAGELWERAGSALEDRAFPLAQGAAGVVIRGGAPLQIGDYGRFERPLPGADPLNIGHMQGFPIAAAGRVTGALMIGAPRGERPFDGHDAAVLEAAARQLGVALERHQAEGRLRDLNRALRTLSATNAAVMRAQDELELLQESCRLLSAEGGYSLAWAGYGREEGGLTVEPVAHAGAVELEAVCKGRCCDGSDHCPVCGVLRSGQRYVAAPLPEGESLPAAITGAREAGLRAVVILPLSLDGATIGVLALYSSREDAFSEEELSLLGELADGLAYGIRARRADAQRRDGEQRLHAALLGTVRAVAATVEKRDPYTAGHQQRVAELAAAIGRELGLDEARVEGLRMGSLIHDIGKIHIPSEILNRPGRISPVEFDLIKAHSMEGYEIVKDIDLPWPVATMIRQHHERLDGSGYPDGLRGEAIGLEARILAVADVVEAILSHRPYRPGLGLEVALSEVEEHRGDRYDPAVVDACLRLFRERGFEFSADAAG